MQPEDPAVATCSGFKFTGLQVSEARVNVKEAPQAGASGQVKFGYGDAVLIEGTTIQVDQAVKVVVHDAQDPTKVYVEAFAHLIGSFEAVLGPGDLTVAKFANENAPAILFPYVREWITKLTSALGNWPSIVLPPANVRELRKNQTLKLDGPQELVPDVTDSSRAPSA